MNWAWQLRLKPTIKFVLMALADAADDDGYCWPSIPTLARKTCMDERSVQRVLKDLKESKLVEINARYRNDGSPTSNGYRLSMKKTGDNLSPPPRQAHHEVVVAIPPPSGANVTLTTTEPSINQKIPQPQSNNDLKAEEFFRSSGGTDYFYPKQLSIKEREIAKTQLDSIDAALAQNILDELAARLNANKVTGAPLSYLRSLITRAKTGQFMPEAGVRVASARDRVLLADAQKTSQAIKPSNPSEIHKHLAAMHQVLARKSTLNLNQED